MQAVCDKGSASAKKSPYILSPPVKQNLCGVCIVTRSFESLEENKVSVSEGEHVLVWNKDNRDWYWIVKHDTLEEGFVPSSHLKDLYLKGQQSLVQGEGVRKGWEGGSDRTSLLSET